MTAAVFLITVVTTFSNSCLYAMIQQEKEGNGPYEAIFHNLNTEQAERLGENEQVERTWKLTKCKEGDTYKGRSCYGVAFKRISLSIFQRSVDVGREIDMDPLPEEERPVLFSRINHTVISTYDITFNEKLLGYYGINAAGVTAGSAWAIILIDIVIVFFAAALLYYVVLSGLEEKLKTLGLLDGIGVSDQQKRIYIYGENVLAGMLAVPLGTVFGLGTLAVSIRQLNQWFLPTQEVEMHLSPIWILAVIFGCVVLVFVSGAGLYARARNERILDLISGYDDKEEVNRTAVLLKAKKHFFRVETLLAAKNVIVNHKNYVVSATLLIISLCVFLNGAMYIQGMTAVTAEIPSYPPISMWVTGEGEKQKAYEDLSEKVEELEEVEEVSLIRQADGYTALEGMNRPEIEAYLGMFQAQNALDSYQISGTYRQEDLIDGDSLGNIVRIIGVDEAIFQSCLNRSGIKGKVPKNSAILFRNDRSGLRTMTEFPVMVQKEIHEIPVVCTNPEGAEEVLLPEYLLTAEEGEKGVGLYSQMEAIILYVTMETFEELLGDKYHSTVYMEITLRRDGRKVVSLNDILYPDHVIQRMKEDGQTEEKIRKTAEELGMDQLQIYSFAEEYHRSFFQGGKGMRILLVTALVSASHIAAILVILQKDSACIRRRKREFALLFTVGMTRGRIWKMIFLEHLFYGVAGIVVGIPLSLFFLSGIYNDGGARQMNSAWDIPVKLVLWQIVLTLFVVFIPFVYTIRELKTMDVISEIRREE